jgi:hypothetical protein
MGSISPAFSKYVYEIWLRNKNKELWYETQPPGQLPVNRVVYPEPTNKKRLTTTVRVTLKRTLTTNQKRHPLPIASRVFRTAGHDRGAIFLSKRTSSKTASR